MDSKEFAQNIKALRLKKGLTQKQFADKLNVTYQAVSKWETGKNLPDLLIIKEICTIFNTNIDNLLTSNKKNKNTKIWIIVLTLLLATIITFVSIIIKNSSNFEFKTITSNCGEFTITGSAAYNKKKTSIYISDVNYCGREDTTTYNSFTCNLYEEYRNTKTKIGACGEYNQKGTLQDFVSTIELNVNNYVASCKMFSSSILYLEISAKDEKEKITTYQIPMNLEENCQNK